MALLHSSSTQEFRPKASISISIVPSQAHPGRPRDSRSILSSSNSRRHSRNRSRQVSVPRPTWRRSSERGSAWLRSRRRRSCRQRSRRGIADKSRNLMSSRGPWRTPTLGTLTSLKSKCASTSRRRRNSTILRSRRRRRPMRTVRPCSASSSRNRKAPTTNSMTLRPER